MKNWRNAVETQFQNLGHFLCRYKYIVALTLFVLAIGLGSQIKNLTIDTSPLAMLRDTDQAILDYNDFRDQFGADEFIVVGIGPTNLFSNDFLLKLKALHNDLEENVPNLEDITSLLNARNTWGDDDSLIVEDLLEEWPQNAEEMRTLEAKVRANPLYKNLLVNEECTVTTLIIRNGAYSFTGQDQDFDSFDSTPDVQQDRQYLTDEENSQIVLAVKDVLSRHKSENFPIVLSGSPVVSHELNTWVLRDMRLFLSLAILLMAVLLFLVFRKIGGMVWPILTVMLSLTCTLGIMALANIPIKIATQILPSFLLAVGVASSVHVLTIFYRRLSFGDKKEDAIAFTLGHSGLAITLASLTTAGGLLSFASAEIAPIGDLGKFSALGVLIALVYTTLWLPAMLAIFPAKPARTSEKNSRLDKFLAGTGRFATSHPKGVLTVAGTIIVIAVIGMTQLQFSHDPVRFFPPDADIRIATEALDKALGGISNMEVVVDLGKENAFHDPALVEQFSRLSGEVEAFKDGLLGVGQTQSLADVVKEINQALHDNEKTYYGIPEDRRLLAQELLLFENSGSDDLEDLVDSDYSKARFTITLPFIDASSYDSFDRAVNAWFLDAFAPEATITTTGLFTILMRTFHSVTHTMLQSYIIAIGVITLLMIILIGDLRVGLLSMIPNLSPILLCLGFMGLAGISLDTFTIVVGSIALGLAVDDTIHFMHNFRRYLNEYDDVPRAVQETLLTTGRAMLFTSIVLALGFLVMIFASITNVAVFGILTSSAIFLALMADFLVAPALMALVFTKKNLNTQSI